MNRLRNAVWLGWVAVVLGCGSGPSAVPTEPLSPARLYPLAAGSAWSYDVDAGDGSTVLAIARVTEASATHAAVAGAEGVSRYELRADGIYRADRGGYLLKAPLRVGARWDSGQGMEAEIVRMDATVQSPAGTFSNCVEVVERGAPSGAVITTQYCPDVGPVSVVSALELSTGSVRVAASLRGYQIGSAAAPNP